jgi:hypothetical protein
VTAWTGGCQCGAVRFRVEGELGRASICHCRMCQKAFGAFFGPYVAVDRERLLWTRGAPKHFQSSNLVRRGFCGECGTQLTFETPRSLDLAIGAFDEPAAIRPAIQIGEESKLPWVDALRDLPGRPPEEAAKLEGYYDAIVSHQHPDHDTAEWPLFS